MRLAAFGFRGVMFQSFYFLIPILFMMMGPFSVGDLCVWISHGIETIHHKSLLTNDLFSFLPTTQMVYPAWLPSIFYGFIFLLSNLQTVALFHQLVLIAMLALIYRHSIYKISAPYSFRVRMCIYLFWIGSMPAWLERPSFLALLPFVFSFLILDKKEELSNKNLLHLSLINICWVNMHGSFITLFGMFGWRIVMRVFLKKNKSLKELWGMGIVLMTTLINPFGIKVFPYVIETIRLSKERNISEWSAPLLESLDGLSSIVIYILLLLLAAYFIRKKRWPLSSPFTALLFLPVLGIRNIALPAMVLLPFMFNHFENIFDQKKKREIWPSNYFMNIVLIILIIIVTPWSKEKIGNHLPLPKEKKYVFDQFALPEITSYLNQSSRQCNLLNRWEYGSYLMLFQKHKIAIDTRNIIFSDSVYKQYSRVLSGKENWRKYISKYQVCYVLLDIRSEQGLIKEMLASGRWKEAVRERSALLLEKTSR